jgi:hypothetical protein
VRILLWFFDQERFTQDYDAFLSFPEVMADGSFETGFMSCVEHGIARHVPAAA